VIRDLRVVDHIEALHSFFPIDKHIIGKPASIVSGNGTEFTSNCSQNKAGQMYFSKLRNRTLSDKVRAERVPISFRTARFTSFF
jgi:hypothetical protein